MSIGNAASFARDDQAREAEQAEQVAVAAKCRCYGDGLHEACAKQHAFFWIEAADCHGRRRERGGDSFFVAIRGPSQVRARILDRDDGTYVVHWSPNVSGTYSVAISLFGDVLPGAPFTVSVTASLPWPAHCSVSGGALHEAVSNVPQSFMVRFRDRLNCTAAAVDLDVFVEPVPVRSPRAVSGTAPTAEAAEAAEAAAAADAAAAAAAAAAERQLGMAISQRRRLLSRPAAPAHGGMPHGKGAQSACRPDQPPAGIRPRAAPAVPIEGAEQAPRTAEGHEQVARARARGGAECAGTLSAAAQAVEKARQVARETKQAATIAIRARHQSSCATADGTADGDVGDDPSDVAQGGRGLESVAEFLSELFGVRSSSAPDASDGADARPAGAATAGGEGTREQGCDAVGGRTRFCSLRVQLKVPVVIRAGCSRRSPTIGRLPALRVVTLLQVREVRLDGAGGTETYGCIALDSVGRSLGSCAAVAPGEHGDSCAAPRAPVRAGPMAHTASAGARTARAALPRRGVPRSAASSRRADYGGHATGHARGASMRAVLTAYESGAAGGAGATGSVATGSVAESATGSATGWVILILADGTRTATSRVKLAPTTRDVHRRQWERMERLERQLQWERAGRGLEQGDRFAKAAVAGSAGASARAMVVASTPSTPTPGRAPHADLDERAVDASGFAFGGVHPGTLHARGKLHEAHRVHYSIGLSGQYLLHVRFRQLAQTLPGSPFHLVVCPGSAHARFTQLPTAPLRGMVGVDKVQDPTEARSINAAAKADGSHGTTDRAKGTQRAVSMLMSDSAPYGCYLTLRTADERGNACVVGGASIQMEAWEGRSAHPRSRDVFPPETTSSMLLVGVGAAPEQPTIEMGVKDHGDGSALLMWRSRRAGVFTTRVMVDGEDVCGSPRTFELTPAPPMIHQTLLSGDGLEKAIAGTPSELRIRFVDEYANPTLPAAADFRACIALDKTSRERMQSLEPYDNVEPRWGAAGSADEGVYLLSYTALEAGTVRLHAWYEETTNGERIAFPGSPFALQVRPGEASTAQSKVSGYTKVIKEGQENAKYGKAVKGDADALVAGDAIIVRPEVFDDYGNPTVIAGSHETSAMTVWHELPDGRRESLRYSQQAVRGSSELMLYEVKLEVCSAGDHLLHVCINEVGISGSPIAFHVLPERPDAQSCKLHLPSGVSAGDSLVVGRPYTCPLQTFDKYGNGATTLGFDPTTSGLLVPGRCVLGPARPAIAPCDATPRACGQPRSLSRVTEACVTACTPQLAWSAGTSSGHACNS